MDKILYEGEIYVRVDSSQAEPKGEVKAELPERISYEGKEYVRVDSRLNKFYNALRNIEAAIKKEFTQDKYPLIEKAFENLRRELSKI